MRRSSGWRAGVLTLWLSACATGAGNPDFDDDGTTASSGSGARGGTSPTSCDSDAYCASLTDDCNRGRCVSGECVAEASNEQLECDDDDPCTTSGTCDSGSCQGGNPVDCSALDDTCGVGVCDAAQGCVKQPDNVGEYCDDGLFCTDNDVCDAAGTCAGPAAYDCGAPTSACATLTCVEAQGACAEVPVTTCLGGDGCCPSGCTPAQDSDCNCTTNLALTATPLSSGGGAAPCCAVSEMNNTLTEPNCAKHWVDNSTAPSGAYIEYQWPSPVTIGSTYIATQQASSTACGNTAGRNVNSGLVQYWDGAAWVTAASFSGELDDVVVDLPQQISTTRLRIFDMTASPGNGNSIIYEWFVFPVAGCMP